jgi:hypothetical protein
MKITVVVVSPLRRTNVPTKEHNRDAQRMKYACALSACPTYEVQAVRRSLFLGIILYAQVHVLQRVKCTCSTNLCWDDYLKRARDRSRGAQMVVSNSCGFLAKAKQHPTN